MLCHRDFLADGALDIAQQRTLFVIAEATASPEAPAARSAADAMDIGIGHEGQDRN